jgi:hypothetical protein
VFSNDLTLRAIYDTVGALGALHHPDPTSTLQLELESDNNSKFSEVTGEIYKMELDGTVLGDSAAPENSSASSPPFTPSTAATRTSFVAEITGCACSGSAFPGTATTSH